MKNKKTWKNLPYLLPSLAGVLYFYIVPFLDVVKRSFMDDMGRTYVGSQNYARILQSRNFLLAGKNTLIFIVCSTPVLLAASLCTAVLLQQKTKEIRRKDAGIARTTRAGKTRTTKTRAARTTKSGAPRLTVLYLLPLAIPVAALTGVWKIFFYEYGLANALLHTFGIGKIDWLGSGYSMPVVIATYLWRNFGYTMVLWLAGLSAIDQRLYEAAALEGADAKKQFYYITMPLLKPLGFTVSVLAVLNTFKVFRDIYLISGDYPNRNIYMVQHILNNWFTNMEFGKITAAALVIVFIAGWLVFGLQLGFSWQKRRDYYGQDETLS